MRLIDADALIKDIDGDLLDGIAEARAIEKIENAPTVCCETCNWYYEEHCCNGESNDCTEGVLKCHVCEYWEHPRYTPDAVQDGQGH